MAQFRVLRGLTASSKGYLRAFSPLLKVSCPQSYSFMVKNSEEPTLQPKFLLMPQLPLGFRRFLERFVQGGDVRRALDGPAFHRFLPRAELETRILLLNGMVGVGAGTRGFGEHFSSRRMVFWASLFLRDMVCLSDYHATRVVEVFKSNYGQPIRIALDSSR